jgi:F-type H+-transporting ATPase subunit a
VSVSIDEQQVPGEASRDGKTPRAARGRSGAGGPPAEQPPAPSVADQPGPPPRRRSAGSIFKVLIPAIIVLDVLAFIFIPPYPKDAPGTPISGIPDLISANLELPAPNVVWDLDPAHPPAAGQILFFHPSISSTLFSSWLVMGVILVALILATRGLRLVPTRVQNAVEFVFEALENFAISLGGEAARPYVPVFAGFFLFILFANWSGLLPIFGRVEALRAPTSDINITIGLAICSFLFFEYQGFRRLGVRGYLGKFFVFSGFKEGFGNGVVGLFVGLIEFFLEFIKPVTLSMRLFGNIFGGEVALAVLTALTIAIIPVGMLGLELLLNFVQALIFSTLTLMFTLIAIESHEEEAHAAPELRDLPQGNIGPPLTGTAGAAH